MRWIPYLNVALVIALISSGTLFLMRSPEENTLPEFPQRTTLSELPKSPFAMCEETNVDEGPLALTWVPPLMQLPDLREELLFFGQNGRPDASQGRAAFHIGLQSSGETRSIRENERIYLVYEGHYGSHLIDKLPAREPIAVSARPLWGEVSTVEKGNYFFSPDNQPTPLWIETHATEEDALSVIVNMLDEKGALVKAPEACRQISLTEREFPKSQLAGWELGGYRVDSTLLVRQKARWIGSDRFLEMHGGDEFAHIAGMERIDFLDAENHYSCFIGPNNFLIWKDNRWMTPLPGEETEGFPLLSIRKIDEKILSLELWDPEGRAKTVLSLIRARDLNKTPNLAQEFKFVGAKTWAQFIVECRNGGRLTLKPNDWLVLTQEGWKKLDSADEIDKYVDGKLTGPLFILDKMTKQNGRQVLVGHLFNSSRTEVEAVELEAASNTSLANYCRTIPIEPPLKTHIEGDEE